LTNQFISIDPDVAQTDQPYVFTNDDPLNMEDPLGLCSWYDVVCGVTSAGKWAVHHPWQAVGLVVGVIAAGTGVGAVIEITAGATALGFGLAVTASVSGIVATSIDGTYCHEGDQASCIGLAFGLTGTLTGGIATGGSLFATTGSVADSVLQGLGAFSSVVGVAGIITDTTITVAKVNTKTSTKSSIKKKTK